MNLFGLSFLLFILGISTIEMTTVLDLIKRTSTKSAGKISFNNIDWDLFVEFSTGRKHPHFDRWPGIATLDYEHISEKERQAHCRVL